MATLIKNHTTNQWDTVNKDYSVAFGYPGTIVDFAGPTENFTENGWLLCDGTEYNVGDYPALYKAIGNLYGGTAGSTFCVPDYRETVRVGAGTSTRAGIAAHDVYNVGQFKDDQEQRVTGGFHIGNYWVAVGTGGTTSGAFYNTQYTAGTSKSNTSDTLYDTGFDNARVARAGTTTHGKQIGVNTYIHI